MGQMDEENPVSEDEAQAEKQKLQPNPLEEMEMQKVPIRTRDAGYPEVIVGQTDPMIKSHHLKYMLIGFNGFVTILGIAMLAVTIWIRVDPEFWEYETTLNVDSFHTVCAMFIVASLVIIIVGVLGCMGASTERRWMLILYMTLFSLILVLEIAALGIMWSAPYSNTIATKLQEKLEKQIRERETEDASRFFVDFIQEHLYCCGATSIKDYGGKAAPNSCQDSRTGVIYPEGCVKKFLLYLRSKAGIVGGLALPILVIQLLALVASGCLIRSLELESRYFMRD